MSKSTCWQFPSGCLIVLVGLSGVLVARVADAAAELLPTVDAVLASKQDLWGLAAMRQPNGPSYEFFEPLLPPLRYVNAEFRDYPLVLSAPNGRVKSRLISNGSGLNARSGSKKWRECALPVSFRVGEDEALFGADLRQLEGPHLERGYLPIVRLSYRHAAQTYAVEAYAATEPVLAEYGVTCVRFAGQAASEGRLAVRFDATGPWFARQGTVSDTNGQTVAWFDSAWQWDPTKTQLVTRVSRQQPRTVAFAPKPVPTGTILKTTLRRKRPSALSAAREALNSPATTYEAQRESCRDTWQSILAQGTQIEVPEARVNHAWRALVISLFTLVNGDHLNYSAGNGYERQYEAECGDAVRALLMFGHVADAWRTLLPLLDYVQQGLRFHDAAFKLQMLSHYFWLTRDTNVIAETRGQWERETGYIVNGREPATGLLPRESYCGDIDTQVYSLNSSANSWRGLRDFAAVLETVGDREAAQRFDETAAAFRQSILTAVEKSERRDVQPTFLPVALFGEEQPYDVLTATKLGAYWCLMAPYVLGSGVFGPRAVRERAMVDYLHEHGGVVMGLIRFDMHANLFANSEGLDDLYGLRYTIKLLELDEADRALVSFYGKLAHGLTRDTFVGAEGTSFRALDSFGRPLYLPPNSSAQAYFLWMLRYLLVQDWDLDDDGKPETLRLGFASSRRWLEDGKTIKVEHAPTAFGELSMRIQSRLRRGEVVANLELPARNPPKQTLLRIRVPEGWRVVSAKAGKATLPVDERGTADISPLKGRTSVRFQVSKAPT